MMTKSNFQKKIKKYTMYVAISKIDDKEQN